MFRKPVFWIVFAAVAAACSFFSFKMFPQAFPIVNLDLRMDRETALSEARSLAEDHAWGPEGYRQAASFSLDDAVQAFVELEGGGTEAFTAMMQDGLYEAYHWNVRHFKEGETNEVVIRFDPAGRPYGFRERMPEDEPGAVLDSEAARVIAEASVASPWRVDLDEYERVEASEELRPGGRVDHTFVYERPDIRIGEGRYRLRLVVSGERFTELTHFVKIPEAFTRRYEEMRSANEGIGAGGSIAMILLYGVGGIGIGLFILLRKRAVLWKQALLWGLLVSFLQAMVAVNRWPLAWMGYDTALSAGNHAMQQIVMIVLQFLGLGAILALAFMAAEGLTRMAFPDQIQLWKLWSKDVAGTRTVLGMTVGGFLGVTLFMAYDVSLYFFAHEKLGWWTPSSAQIDPDILATYFPWLESIAISFQAGFLEECLFRAVPIAGAALIGQRFGGRRYWIIGAFIVQALIFGAGHAAYPTQPSYARVVELIIPSIGFGLIYMRFGLLAGIVLHYAIDVVWISLPLFTSTAPGIWTDRSAVVVLCLVPLGVVLAARARRGSWGGVASRYLNGAWAPPEERAIPAHEPSPQRVAGLGAATRVAVIALGVAGLAAWIVMGRFTGEAPPIEIGRGEARAAAREALEERGFVPEGAWREMSTVTGGAGPDDRFVWTEGGPDEYRGLLGEYLPPPRWSVRYGRFEGDVADRAEEYTVGVDGEGGVFRVRHTLPEAAPGATLDEDQARAIALGVVNDLYDLGEADLEDVSAKPSKLPERTDWTFEFRDPAAYSLEEGEARIAVVISGDEVVDTRRYVHVPEEWEREDRNRQTVLRVLGIVSGVGIAALFGAGAIGGVVFWSRRRFSVRPFLIAGAAMFALGVLNLMNGWPSMEAAFSTAQPYMLQAGLAFGFGIIGMGLLAVVIGLNVGLAHEWLPTARGRAGFADLAAGFGLGLAAAGLGTLTAAVLPQDVPRWAEFGPVANFVPLLTAFLQPVSSFILRTGLAVLVFATVDRMTAGWTRRQTGFSILFLVIGLVLGGTGSGDLTEWIVFGVETAVVLWAAYVFVLRHAPSLIPLASAGIGVPGVLQEGLAGGYSGARVGSIVATVLIVAAALIWTRGLDGGEARE